MLNIGVGKCSAEGKAKPYFCEVYSNVGISEQVAPSSKQACETERMALAPSLDLLMVPSRFSNIWSISFCLRGSCPIRYLLIIWFTLAQAFSTPSPSNRLGSPSLNSKASNRPVEAPLGM